MNKDALYWTIGGVAIALLALYAMSRGGSASQSTSSAPAVNGSALVSEVNNVNSNAAAVEEALLQTQGAYAITDSTNRAASFQNLADMSASELATVQNAATSRYADQLGMAQSEYDAMQNTLSSEFLATQATAQNANSNAAQITENAASAAAATAQAQLAAAEMKRQTDAQVHIADQQSHQQQQSSLWGSILGAAGSIFHFSPGGALAGVASRSPDTGTQISYTPVPLPAGIVGQGVA